MNGYQRCPVCDRILFTISKCKYMYVCNHCKICFSSDLTKLPQDQKLIDYSITTEAQLASRQVFL